MRILSQDGKRDFPYERVCLETTCRGNIFAQGDIWGASVEDNFIEVASYENEAKARKAMEMLYEAYIANETYKMMTENQRALFLSTLSKGEEEKTFGIFRFPKDEEIEV